MLRIAEDVGSPGRTCDRIDTAGEEGSLFVGLLVVDQILDGEHL